MGRILAIDYGERRTGLALSDETRTIAQPHAILESGTGTSGLCRKIIEMVGRYEVDRIILGYPYGRTGRPSRRGHGIEAFRAELARLTPVPIELVDERFTTALAHRYLGEHHHRVRPDRLPVDKVAAVILLEDYLARLTRTGPGSPD
jgi:putative Holliday junction resolvase